jgi:hypothetical protein
MPFVKRDPSGRVVAASEQETADIRDWIEAEDPALGAYVNTLVPRPPEQTRQALEHSDLGLIRVIEDLIDTLLAKDVIRFTDLPAAAQNRLLERRNLRASMNALKLLDGERDANLF